MESHPGGLPLVGYQYRPSTRWQCRTRMWASAPTADRSAANLLLPRGSGRHKTHGEGLAGSRRTGPDSTPAEKNKMLCHWCILVIVIVKVKVMSYTSWNTGQYSIMAVKKQDQLLIMQYFIKPALWLDLEDIWEFTTHFAGQSCSSCYFKPALICVC